MKSLTENVRKMAFQVGRSGNSVDFLDHCLKEPICHNIIRQIKAVDLDTLGIKGRS